MKMKIIDVLMEIRDNGGNISNACKKFNFDIDKAYEELLYNDKCWDIILNRKQDGKK